MGDCNFTYKNGERQARNASPLNSALPETLAANIDGWQIEGNQVIHPKNGRKFTINDFREPTENDKKDYAKAGIDLSDEMVIVPIAGGRLAAPRAVAEKAIELGKQQSENYRKNLEKNVPGIEELENAIAHNEYEYEKQRRSIARGDGRIYTANLIDINPIIKKYPRASAYHNASAYSNSSNAVKAGLGEIAQREIRQGKDYKKAIKKMQDEWAKYAREKAMTD